MGAVKSGGEMEAFDVMAVDGEETTGFDVPNVFAGAGDFEA